MTPNEARALLARIIAGDPGAADDLDRLADQLRALAARIRDGEPTGPPESRGGMGDRVQMKLVGPDGTIKSTHDTGG